jgi:hypothetical protein
MEAWLGIGRRVGRDQGQVMAIGEVEQRALRRLLDRVAAPAELDVKPAREELAKLVEDRLGGVALALGAPSPPPVSAISPSVLPASAASGTCASSSTGRPRWAAETSAQRFS